MSESINDIRLQPSRRTSVKTYAGQISEVF